MRKLLLLLLGVSLTTGAADLFDYGGAYTWQGYLYTQADPPALVSADPTFQAADCNLVRDGATAEACDNTPVWETNGIFSHTISATEAAAGAITVVISDDSGTAFLDYGKDFASYDNDSAKHPDIGNDQLLTACVENAPTSPTCWTMQEIMCVLLAEATGRADYNTGTSTWTVSDPSNSQTRVTLVYGTDDGDRSSSTLALTDC